MSCQGREAASAPSSWETTLPSVRYRSRRGGSHGKPSEIWEAIYGKPHAKPGAVSHSLSRAMPTRHAAVLPRCRERFSLVYCVIGFRETDGAQPLPGDGIVLASLPLHVSYWSRRSSRRLSPRSPPLLARASGRAHGSWLMTPSAPGGGASRSHIDHERAHHTRARAHARARPRRGAEGGAHLLSQECATGWDRRHPRQRGGFSPRWRVAWAKPRAADLSRILSSHRPWPHHHRNRHRCRFRRKQR